MRDKLAVVLIGGGLGAALQRIGFASWDEVHRMFTFASLRMFLAFASGAAILMFVWPILRRLQDPDWAPRRVHPGTLPGGILFGAGWAICGACPLIALVQLGEGKLYPVFTLAGIVVGNFAYPLAHARWFRWSTRSCADD